MASLGSSILVPSVLELAKESMVNVPPRYLRPDQEPPLINSPLPSISIPIIDMDKLLLQESSAAELERLHSACKEWGFFQLVNHGVSSSLVENMKYEIQNFFKLPLEEKKRFWQQPGDLEGFGQVFVVSEEQKLDWGDMFYLTTLTHHMKKCCLFDHLPLSFRSANENHLCLPIGEHSINLATQFDGPQKNSHQLTICNHLIKYHSAEFRCSKTWVFPLRPRHMIAGHKPNERRKVALETGHEFCSKKIF